MNDNISNFGNIERTVRPQETLQRTSRPQMGDQPAPQMMQQQRQQQAAGKACPYCGAINSLPSLYS